jgi:hypothetical protein
MRLDWKMWGYRCGCWVLCSPWLWLGYAELATCTSQSGNVNFWIWQSGLEKQVNWTWQKYPGSVIHTSILDLKFGVEHHAEDPLHFEQMLISKAEAHSVKQRIRFILKECLSVKHQVSLLILLLKSSTTGFISIALVQLFYIKHWYDFLLI